MKTENEIIEQIKEQRLLPLFYHADKNGGGNNTNGGTGNKIY